MISKLDSTLSQCHHQEGFKKCNAVKILRGNTFVHTNLGKLLFEIVLRNIAVVE